MTKLFIQRGSNVQYQDNIQKSIATPISEERIGTLLGYLKSKNLESSRLYHYIQDHRDTLFAWGSKLRQKSIVKQMVEGEDYAVFLVQGIFKAIGKISFVLKMDEVPEEVNKKLSYFIWDEEDYSNNWFLTDVKKIDFEKEKTERFITDNTGKHFEFNTFLGRNNLKFLDNSVVSENDTVRLVNYFSGKKTTPKTKKLVLIGASLTFPEWGSIARDFIKERGAYADWWSFPIRKQYHPLLKNELPGKLYIYMDGTIEYVYLFDDFISQTGNTGIQTPWPESTKDEEVGKTQKGSKKSEIFKTWLKVIKLKELEKPLTLDDFLDYETEEELSPYAMRNSFGYAIEKFDDEALKKTSETDIVQLLGEKKQIILYGPPGTGKTFKTKEYSLEFLKGKK